MANKIPTIGETLVRISTAFPSEYLRAADLDGKQVTLKLSHVTMAEVGGELKPILHFQGKEKGMVLNKTNANTIATAYGDNTDEWDGQSVTLYEAQVEFQGKVVPGLRIRIAPKRMPPRPVAELIDDEIPPF